MLVKTPSLPIPVGGRLSGDNVLVSHSFVGDGRADRHRFERRLGIVDDVARELDLDSQRAIGIATVSCMAYTLSYGATNP